MMKKTTLFLSTLLFVGCSLAQFSDSLHVQIGVSGTLASKDYQPLWLVANKWGTVADRRADLSPHIIITNAHYFKSKRSSDTSLGKKNGLYINYGADLYLNNQAKDVFFEKLYLKAGYKNLELRVGRF